MMNEPIKTIMITDIVSLKASNTMQDAKDMFVKKKFHHIPILDGENLVGVITKSDLWKSGKPFSDYATTPLKEVMTTEMVSLTSDQRIGVAAELFLENRFGYIPILDGKKLEGLVSSFDILLYSFKKEYPRQFD